MRFFYKTSLVLLLLFALAIGGINLYLKSSGLKGLIRSQAEAATGMLVQVKTISFVPWRGLSLEQIVIENPTNGRVFEIGSFSIPIFTIIHFLRNPTDWRGSVHLSKVAMNQRVFLGEGDFMLVRKGSSFSVAPFSGRVLGGKIKGSLVVPNIEEGAYELNVQFSAIPLKNCLAGTSFQNKIHSGTVQGTIVYSGVSSNSRLQKGSGTLELISTEIKSAGMIGSVSALLPLEEFQVLKLQEAKAAYKITSDRVLIHSLKLRSQNLMLTASGELSFTGMWNLNAQLLLNTSLQQRLESLVPVTFAASPEPGYQQISFSVSGSPTHVQSDFLNKIMMKQVTNQVQGVLQNQVNGTLQNILNNAQKGKPSNLPVNIPVNLPVKLPIPLSQ